MKMRVAVLGAILVAGAIAVLTGTVPVEARPPCTTAGFPVTGVTCTTTFGDPGDTLFGFSPCGFDGSGNVVNPAGGPCPAGVAVPGLLAPANVFQDAAAGPSFGTLGPGTVTNNMFGKIVDFDGTTAGWQTDLGDRLWNPLLQGQTIPALQATAGVVAGCPSGFSSCNTAGLMTVSVPSGTIIGDAVAADGTVIPALPGGFFSSMTDVFQFVPVLGVGIGGCPAGTATEARTCVDQSMTQTVPEAGGVELGRGPVEDIPFAGNASLTPTVTVEATWVTTHAADGGITGAGPTIEWNQDITEGTFLLRSNGTFSYNGAPMPTVPYLQPTGATLP